ncbi:MAG: ATP-binding cassette domain-containing protein [Chitinivibrionales bacterium]|nr:ATP-binding cassette domain-containing protein [Chitinivibrionales bacterium]MBD3356946.1 ATP-binding cassette domain-containing protein [Chitinivibrionales bacterium]
MIEFDSVTKRYGSVVAVDTVSCTVEKGEFFALLGPNGAGKTTLVRIMMGFSTAGGGATRIGGVSSGTPAARKSLGYLAENHRIPPFLTGWSFVMRCAVLRGITGDRARRAVDEAVGRVGMSAESRRKARGYSKGMSQRIGLAAAIVGNPDILVLDEPTSGLDPIGVRDVRELLKEQHGRGATIFLNSHYLTEVERLCNTAAVINRGKIVVKDAVEKIAVEGESLEDVFVRLVEGRNESTR